MNKSAIGLAAITAIAAALGRPARAGASGSPEDFRGTGSSFETAHRAEIGKLEEAARAIRPLGAPAKPRAVSDTALKETLMRRLGSERVKVKGLEASKECRLSDLEDCACVVESADFLSVVARGPNAAHDGLHLQLNWPFYYHDPSAVIPEGAVECNQDSRRENDAKTGASNLVLSGFDLRPGESCVFQNSAVIVRVALEAATGRYVRLKVSGYHAYSK